MSGPREDDDQDYWVDNPDEREDALLEEAGYWRFCADEDS